MVRQFSHEIDIFIIVIITQNIYYSLQENKSAYSVLCHSLNLLLLQNSSNQLCTHFSSFAWLEVSLPCFDLRVHLGSKCASVVALGFRKTSKVFVLSFFFLLVNSELGACPCETFLKHDPHLTHILT